MAHEWSTIEPQQGLPLCSRRAGRHRVTGARTCCSDADGDGLRGRFRQGCSCSSSGQGHPRFDSDAQCSQRVNLRRHTDLLKLSDETDLDILNSSMESMVEHFQDELLPVAAQLTARLVCATPLADCVRA